MAFSARTQNVLLGALAALAVSVSVYAVWVVNQPHPSLIDGGGSQPVMTASPTPAESPVETEAVTSAEMGADDAQATQPPETEEETTGPEPAAFTTREWLEPLDGNDVSLQVIGDGYSNMDWQWLQQWAGILAQQRPVDIRHWGEAEDLTYNAPIVLSEGDGSELTVWSASRAGSSIADARERMDRFQNEAEEPSAVLISLGGSSEGEDVAAEMDGLLAELPDVPVLLAIAPDGFYPAGVADSLAEWAQDNDERVALVDLRETGLVDPSVEQWAFTFHEALTEGAEQDR